MTNEALRARFNAGGVLPPASVLVWDILVRVLHWSLVAVFAIAFITAEELDRLHEWAGYAAVGLVAVRLAWGFIGTQHARFSDFVRGPGVMLGYLGELLRGREPRYLGHNPLGAAMILALLAGILALGATGYTMTQAGGGGDDMLNEIHEVIANGMLVLIALHVAGVILASLRHSENLVASMLWGRKRAER